MNAREILITARARVASGWCQGATARDANGDAVRGANPTACAWCASSAIWTTKGNRCDQQHLLASELFCQAVGIEPVGGAIPDWNDAPQRTKAEVLDAFDKAIALAEREEAAR